MKHGYLFRDGPLEVVDRCDRRVHYWLVPSEDGLPAVIYFDPPVGSGRRMRCVCPDGEQAYSDRLDGDDRATPCEHEAALMAYNRKLTESHRPAPDYPPTPAFFE